MSAWIKARLWLVAVPALVATGCFLFVWFSPAAKPPPRPQDAETLRLACDHPSVDVGEIGIPKAAHTYTLRNPYTRELRITKIGKSCSCLEPHFDRTVLGPGETANMDVSIHVNPKNPALLTRFRERLSIHCNDRDERLELELSGTYVPPLYYETTQINLIAPEMIGEPFEGKFEVFLRRAKDVKIRQVQVRTIVCEASVSSRNPVGQGDFDKAAIVIQGKLSESPLPQTGALVIQTTSVDVPTIQVPIVLFNPRTDALKIEPPRLAVGIVTADSQICREVTIHLPGGDRYEVEEVTSSSPRIAVTQKQSEDDGKRKTNSLGFRCIIDCKGVMGKIDPPSPNRLVPISDVEASWGKHVIVFESRQIR